MWKYQYDFTSLRIKEYVCIMTTSTYDEEVYFGTKKAIYFLLTAQGFATIFQALGHFLDGI